MFLPQSRYFFHRNLLIPARVYPHRAWPPSLAHLRGSSAPRRRSSSSLPPPPPESTSRSSGGRACPAASRLESISKQAHADPSCPRHGHATIYTPERFHPPRASAEAADRSRRATLRRCRVFSRSAAPPPCRGGGISSNRCRMQACTSPTADAVAGAVPRGGDYEPDGERPAAAADRHLLRLAARERPGG